MRALVVLLVLAAFAAWLWQLRDGAAAETPRRERIEGLATTGAPVVEEASDGGALRSPAEDGAPSSGHGQAAPTAQERLEGKVVDDQGAGLPGVRVGVGQGAGRREVETDIGGGFAFDDLAPMRGALDASLAGHVQVSATRPRHRDYSGWEPARVVMAPGATLALWVTAGGRPLVGEQIPLTVGLRRGETEVGYRLEWNGERQASTDERGEVRFEELWARHRIEVSIERGWQGRWSYHADGRLVAADHPDARPLVLDPGQDLALELPLPGLVTIRGTVRDAQGAAVADAHVQACRLGPANELDYCGATQSDEQGRYMIGPVTVDGDQRLRLASTEGEQGLYSAHIIERLAVAVADPAHAVDGELEVDLWLEVRPAIAGRVIDGEGQPLRGRVAALPEFEWPVATDPGALKLCGIRDGVFRIGGLVAGTYTLEVREAAQEGGAWRRFPGIAAGDEDVELRVGAPRDVTIRVEVACEDRIGTCIAVLLPAGAPLAPLGGPSRHQVVELHRWPDTIVGIGGGNDVRKESGRDGRHEFADLRPGRFVIGAAGTVIEEVEGGFYEHRLYPLATAPMDLGPGEHVLVFHLSRAAHVTGKVDAPADAPALAVALLDGGGNRLPLFPNGHTPTDLVELSGRGGFEVAVAPSGRFELAVGTVEELRADRPRGRFPVTIVAGEAAPIEVSLER